MRITIVIILLTAVDANRLQYIPSLLTQPSIEEYTTQTRPKTYKNRTLKLSNTLNFWP